MSKDRAGAGLGVDRQRQDCEDLAQRLGWHSERRPPRGGRRATLALGALAATLVATGLAAAPASAGTTPSTPTGVRVTAASASSFTVDANRSTYATTYQLFASTTRSDVYAANLALAHHSAVSTTPHTTVTGLPYTTATYWYRFLAINGTSRSYSDILAANVAPPTPTSAGATSSSRGTSVTWAPGSATGYSVTQASDPAMTVGRRTYVLKSLAGQFAPYALSRGTRYYFQVRALNGAIASPATPVVSAVAAASEQAVRVLSYNVQEADSTGIQGDGPIPTWSERRPGVVRYIQQADADVVGLQEAAAYVGPVQGRGGVRQADDITAALGGTYALARTEVPPTEPGYFRTAQYVLYKPSVYAPVGAGGHWTLGTVAPRFAAYQVLQNRATGARFLFVSVHLSTGNGADADTLRQTQTESMIAQASAYAATVGNPPVVYAGDYNSHLGSNHVFDGPGNAFRAVRGVDGLQVAQSLTNAQYNSANQDRHVPPASGLSIDHVYASPGVAIRNWRLWLDLVDGQLVGAIPSDHNPLSVDVSFPY